MQEGPPSATGCTSKAHQQSAHEAVQLMDAVDPQRIVGELGRLQLVHGSRAEARCVGAQAGHVQCLY